MWEQMYKLILQLDFQAWRYINTVWHHPLADAVLPFIRNQYFWGPLYLFLLLFVTVNFGKKGWIWCGVFLITFALSDYISASVIKPAIQRVRPCNNPYLWESLRLLVPRSGGYSFPSSHAANHFSLGLFIALTLGKRRRAVQAACIAWAVLISYSQVYVGVHYPLDILCGAILGAGIGLLTGSLYNKKFPLSPAARNPKKVKNSRL